MPGRRIFAVSCDDASVACSYWTRAIPGGSRRQCQVSCLISPTSEPPAAKVACWFIIIHRTHKNSILLHRRSAWPARVDGWDGTQRNGRKCGSARVLSGAFKGRTSLDQAIGEAEIIRGETPLRLLELWMEWRDRRVHRVLRSRKPLPLRQQAMQGQAGGRSG